MQIQRFFATIIGFFIFIGMVYLGFLFAWYIAVPVILITLMLFLIVVVVNRLRGRRTVMRVHRVSQHPDIIDVDFRDIR